jgi:hypothetical protein
MLTWSAGRPGGQSIPHRQDTEDNRGLLPIAGNRVGDNLKIMQFNAWRVQPLGRQRPQECPRSPKPTDNAL